MAEASVREAYARMTSGEATTAPRDDNECCICFDDMDTAKESFW